MKEGRENRAIEKRETRKAVSEHGSSIRSG